MINPNSKNQIWSKWTFLVIPGVIKNRPFREVEINCARFGRKAFGSSSEMRLRQNKYGVMTEYCIEILTEGHPVHDPQFCDYMLRNFRRFFVSGFGTGTKVKMTTKLMSGSRQDGTPSDQLLVIPTLNLRDNLEKEDSHG